MSPAERSAPAPDWLLRHELALVVVACALAFLSIPLALGRMGLSWDALNHHFYLGWTAWNPRFTQDHMAASYQAYQFPYLYWPAYQLAALGTSGRVAGMVLALLPLLAVPAVWMLARTGVPGRDWSDVALRALAVALAFMNGVVLSMFDTTANDLLASIPLVWSLALGMAPLAPAPGTAPDWRRAMAWSGFWAGVGVAFKLSNGVIALVFPLLWLWGPGPWRARAGRLLLAMACAAAGLLLAYGYWGWQLWSHYGNPIYPLYDNWFELPRQWLGWHR